MRAKVDDLPGDDADRIVAKLEPFVSDRRRERIETSLASRTRDIVLVLEDIHHDHNSSAVLRTAEAMGILELHVIAERARFTIARKISLGAHKWLDVRAHPSISSAYAHLRRRGYQIWASHFHGASDPIDRIPEEPKVALVFGNEHEGLSTEAIEEADHWFLVPMRGFVESLNISVAAAITMYDVHSRRTRSGRLSGLADQDVRRLRAAWYASSVRAAELILAQDGLPFPVMSTQPMMFSDEEDA